MAISMFGVLQGVRKLLLASWLTALQFTSIDPDFQLHLHNVFHIGCMAGHVIDQDRGEAELSLTKCTSCHLGIVILVQGFVKLKKVLHGSWLIVGGWLRDGCWFLDCLCLWRFAWL